ncbi:MAG: phage holin family protein [Acidobacteriota bacterium]
MKLLSKGQGESEHRDSIGALLEQLASNSATLVRNEIELTKQQMRENADSMRSGAFSLAASAAIGLVAMMAICIAIIIGLTAYMPPGVAALVTGVGLALIAAGVASFGFRQMRQAKANLKRTDLH